MSTLARIRRLVADVFDVPIEQVDRTSSPATIERWDSLQQLNLVLALEQEFGLQLAPEQIEQLTDVGAILELVESGAGG